MSSEGAPAQGAGPRRSMVLAGIVTLAATLVLVMLGTWQLQRLRWKEELIAQVEARVHEAPVLLPPQAQWPLLDAAEWEYRPVRLAGRFDHAREVRQYTVLSEPRGAYRGPGYLILTPMLLDAGGTVVVNRGFVPQDKAAGGQWDRPEGTQTVDGLWRSPEEQNSFTPEPDTAKRLIYARDPAAVARIAGLSDVAPFSVDAAARGERGALPQAGETRLAFPNRHLEYALTWYGLAAALVGVFAALVISRRRSVT